MNSDNTKWTTVIEPKNSLFRLNLGDLWRYRDLIRMLIHRDFVTFYKQTILGPIWFVIQPLFTAGMFTFIFGKVANISTDEIPHMIFYMAGIVNWSYFSECLTKTSQTFIENAGVFGKVYFPRLTVPVSVVITNMIRYIIQYTLFIIVLLWFIHEGAPVNPNLLILFTPLLVIYMAIMSLGFGIWISSLTTKYRDLRFALPFFVQLWMYATPVVYPMSLIPEKYKLILALNPMVPVIEFFRMAYLGAGSMDYTHMAISGCVTAFVFITGVIIFNRMEKTFMDTV